MATSGCPVLDPLKTMAQFHLPFCNTRETLFRTIGAYLTQQYFVRKNGGDPDWGLNGLRDLYNRLETLNQDFSQRIQGLVQGDAMANAIVIFFATSVLVNASIEEQLEREEAFLTGTPRIPVNLEPPTLLFSKKPLASLPGQGLLAFKDG